MTASGTQLNYTVGRNFRKHVSLPLKKWHNPSAYLGRMAKQLNGRVSLLKGIGYGATWVVPAVLGVASAVTAPPELRMREFFKEGFGVLGGAIGTQLGMYGGFGLVAILGLGPFGAFVAIFVCASIAGIAMSEGGKWLGDRTYDAGSSLGGRVYYTVDEMIGSL